MYLFPIDGKITQDFGARPEYYQQYGQKGHNGIDIAAKLNDPVRASRDGVVKFSGKGKDLAYVGAIAGNYVLIDHGDMWTGYAHNNSNNVVVGQKVKQGDTIAYAGMSGDASGVHVHWEFIPPANPVTNNNGFYGRVNPNNYNLIRERSMTQEAIERLVSESYRAATDIDPTQEQAAYWVARIREDNNRAFELSQALGGGTYQGDPGFRTKARTFDIAVKQAFESGQASADQDNKYLPVAEVNGKPTLFTKK